MAELLAWRVGVRGDARGEEWGHEVVYERNEARARVRWARAAGHAPEDVTAEREPELDAHAPGPVPAEALLAAGWWLECAGCYSVLIGEAEPAPVCDGTRLWCSEACRAMRSPGPRGLS